MGMRGQQRQPGWIAAVLAGVGGVLSVAVAAPASTPVPTELLDGLKARALSEREAAMEQLTARADVKLDAIDEALARPDLTPEQRQRLLRVAREKFNVSPRAALGVSFDLGPQENVIQRPIENFPASKVLKPGDQIIEIDGWKLGRRASFRQVSTARPFIISHDPGDVVPITVMRDGEEVKVQVELGRFDRLQMTMPIDDFELARAWNVREATWDRAWGHEIDAGADIDPYPDRGTISDRELSAAREAMAGMRPSVVAGGQAQGGVRADGGGGYEGKGRERDERAARDLGRVLNGGGGGGGGGVALRGGVQIVMQGGNANPQVWINGRPARPDEIARLRQGGGLVLNDPAVNVRPNRANPPNRDPAQALAGRLDAMMNRVQQLTQQRMDLQMRLLQERELGGAEREKIEAQMKALDRLIDQTLTDLQNLPQQVEP